MLGVLSHCMSITLAQGGAVAVVYACVLPGLAIGFIVLLVLWAREGSKKRKGRSS